MEEGEAMVNARDAYRKSVINSKAKIYINNLEKAIDEAMALGAFSATISINIEKHEQKCQPINNLSIKNAIVEELVNLGYKVEFVYAKPIPFGCPTDRWNFNNGHITVWWDEQCLAISDM